MPPAFAGLRACGRAPPRARFDGADGDPGGAGTPGATVIIRYVRLEGDPEQLKVLVAGGRGGPGGAGGKGGGAWCKEGLTGYDVRGRDGKDGPDGKDGSDGSFTLEAREG